MSQKNHVSTSIKATQIVGLPESATRQLKHRRTLTFEVYERDDGLWDIDAQMLDHKAHDITVANKLRHVGEALHDMIVRVTLDGNLTIVKALVKTQNAPYIAICPSINSKYQLLVGLNVLKGFRLAVKERFSKMDGCTHLSDLINNLPTVAIQGIGFETTKRVRELGGGSVERPFQINQCHAFKSDSEVVKLYYPEWYEPNSCFPNKKFER